jgi:protein FRA10AC1
MSPRAFASANAESRRERIKYLLSLPPEERHQTFLDDYDWFYGGGDGGAAARASVIRKPITDDLATVKSTHRFLRTDEDDDALSSWEAKLARRYYDKLFKEYCVCDLSRWRERKIGMRWRIEKEVKDGKGQFFCGDKRCTETKDLASYEVHFGYVEAGERKEALVKLRVCPACAKKLVEGRKGVDEKNAGKEKKKKRSRDDDCESTERKTKTKTQRGKKRPHDDPKQSTNRTPNIDDPEPYQDEETQHKWCFSDMFN